MPVAVRPWHTELTFNAPLSSVRAAQLIQTLQPLAGATVVDLGCGWAELLLRIGDAEPTARGVGVDSDEAAIARARRNATARDLDDRVGFEVGDAAGWRGSADRAIVIGSSHVWGGTGPALTAVRRLLTPGARLLAGEGIWERPPTPAALAGLDAAPDDLLPVGELVDLALERDFRLLALSTANDDEWDDFESRYCAGAERWLLEHPDAPEHDLIRAEVDAHRDGWLHGYRGILGFAYLTLVAV